MKCQREGIENPQNKSADTKHQDALNNIIVTSDCGLSALINCHVQGAFSKLLLWPSLASFDWCWMDLVCAGLHLWYLLSLAVSSAERWRLRLSHAAERASSKDYEGR